jgi:hypothetical protein
MDAVMNSISSVMALVLGSAALYELIVGKVLLPVKGEYRPTRDQEPMIYWIHVLLKLLAAYGLATHQPGTWGVRPL